MSKDKDMEDSSSSSSDDSSDEEEEMYIDTSEIDRLEMQVCIFEIIIIFNFFALQRMFYRMPHNV